MINQAISTDKILLTKSSTVFRWYTAHSLNVTPINPKAPSITALSPANQSTEYETVSGLSQLPDPKHTAVSIITPPSVTKKVLEEAESLGIQAVWLQPGTYDDEVLKYAKTHFSAGIGGAGGGGGEGWCVLVDGEEGLHKAGKLKL